MKVTTAVSSGSTGTLGMSVGMPCSSAANAGELGSSTVCQAFNCSPNEDAKNAACTTLHISQGLCTGGKF